MLAGGDNDHPAPKRVAGGGGRIVFRAAVIVVPGALCALFAQIGWFWAGLGWAGIGLIALIGVMAVYVIATMSRLGSDADTRQQIRSLADALAAQRETLQNAQDLAEMLWCEDQRAEIVSQHRALNGAAWDKTVAAFKDLASEATERDHWTPAAEDLARWVQQHLPAPYTAEDFEMPAPQQAEGEAEFAEARRMEYRALAWRKLMMDRYIEAILAKLKRRGHELHQRVAAAGDPAKRPG